MGLTNGRGSRVLLLVFLGALTAAALVLIRYDVWPWLRGPAPYPPEWQWHYRPHALVRVQPAVAIGGALALVILGSATAAARRAPRRTAAVLLAAAFVLGGAFHAALLDSEDGGAVAHVVSRSASPAYFSYLTVASAATTPDTRTLLAQYPALLPGFPMHAATHPPGPILIYRGLAAGLERLPGLAAFLAARVDAACGPGAARCSSGAQGLSATARSAALLGSWLAHCGTIAALLPIAWIAFQLTRDVLGAARVAALWPLVPGAALFSPAVDPLLALPVVLSWAGIRLACAGERSATRIAGGALAGAATACAAFLSFGAPLLIALGSLAVIASLPPHARTAQRLTAAASAAAVVFLALSAIPVSFGYDPIASARTALSIHREAYTAHRSLPLWLVFGPLDFAMFAGVPVALLLLLRVRGAVLQAARRLALTPPARFALGFVAAFALLTAAGVVRGEVGRILVAWMPAALLAALPTLDDEPGPSASLAAATAALLVFSAAVLRVTWRL